MPLYLAADAGGTKTDLVLATDTGIVARVRTGTIKRLRADAETAQHNLDAALAELQQQSGLPLHTVSRACIGTAGESVPLVAGFIRAELGKRVGGPLLLLGDVEIALDAAFHGNPGVLALAGTGSNVAGRSTTGALTSCGGYGPMLSDQGSGHRIGYEALRALFLALDERRPTLLRQRILDRWNLPSLDHLIQHVHGTPAPDFSRLVDLVLDASNAGDSLALEVLHHQGRELAYLVRLVLRRIQVATPAIACAGSILEHVPPVRDALLADVRTEFPTATMLPGVIDPIDGALWRVRNEAAFHTRLAEQQ